MTLPQARAALIDSDAALAELCAELADAPLLALDTEFLRERTYYPKLCLIQVASEAIAACIDPFKIKDWSPFVTCLQRPQTVKILHSCSQDMEVLLQELEVLPQPLFDTQIAASLLGMGSQIGYANLVQAVCAVELNKDSTRTDWSRRPLSKDQLRYALDDVLYLPHIYQHLHEGLQQRERLSWLAQQCNSWLEPSRYQPDPEQMWKKVRGIDRLKGERLALAQALAAWRERWCQQHNEPRRWLIKDEVLLQIVRQRVQTAADLEQVHGLSARWCQRHGQELLHCLAETRKNNVAPKTPTKRHKSSAEQEAMADALMALVRLLAREQRIDPAQLVTRKALLAWLQEPGEVAWMQGWRGALLADPVRRFVAGETALCWQAGGLQCVSLG